MTTYLYNNIDFLNDTVDIQRLQDEILNQITKTLDSITYHENVCTIIFEESLSSAEETLLDGIVAAHTGEPPDPTPLEEFLDENVLVTDPYTNLEGQFEIMQVLMNRRELFNDEENPLYVSEITPILGENGHLVDHTNRILNVENIHNKTGWHTLEVKKATYQRPLNLLIYYGWLNSFNSGQNGWNNESVAKDMSKYSIIVIGDGIQDSGHGDYSNTQTIVSRIKQLNPTALIFGYVTLLESQSNFETKVNQWNDNLAVHGIFIDEAGYDYGTNRATFNDRIDFIHNRSVSNICFVNSWNIDHIIGTENDVSYPNTTWNPDIEESNLTTDDWYLLESLAVNTLAYSASNGYEAKATWFSRIEKAIGIRYNYGINLAAIAVINNDNINGQDLADFSFVSACMGALEAFGTSDHYYGASSAAITFWNKADVSMMGRIFMEYPGIRQDVSEDDIYWRHVDFGRFMLDFSSSAETYVITKY